VLDELAHRVELLLARGAADDDDAFAALRDRRGPVDEGVPRVPTEFRLNRRDERRGVHAGKDSIFAFYSLGAILRRT
jgi:hypothetical protein